MALQIPRIEWVNLSALARIRACMSAELRTAAAAGKVGTDVSRRPSSGDLTDH